MPDVVEAAFSALQDLLLGEISRALFGLEEEVVCS